MPDIISPQISNGCSTGVADGSDGVDLRGGCNSEWYGGLGVGIPQEEKKWIHRR